MAALKTPSPLSSACDHFMHDNREDYQNRSVLYCIGYVEYNYTQS